MASKCLIFLAALLILGMTSAAPAREANNARVQRDLIPQSSYGLGYFGGYSYPYFGGYGGYGGYGYGGYGYGYPGYYSSYGYGYPSSYYYY